MTEVIFLLDMLLMEEERKNYGAEKRFRAHQGLYSE